MLYAMYATAFVGSFRTVLGQRTFILKSRRLVNMEIRRDEVLTKVGIETATPPTSVLDRCQQPIPHDLCSIRRLGLKL